MTNTQKQLGVLVVILLLISASQSLAVVFIPFETVVGSSREAASLRSAPAWKFAVVIAGSFVFDGTLALAGYWCARRIELPGIFRPGSTWQSNLFYPLLIGLGLGLAAAIVHFLLMGPDTTAGSNSLAVLTNMITAAGASIPNEIVYSLVGISALSWLAITLSGGRWRSRWITGFWILMAAAYGLSVLSFSVSLRGAEPLYMVFVFVVSIAIALVAGRRFIQDGLVASVGVHFWSLFVWHITFRLWSAIW